MVFFKSKTYLNYKNTYLIIFNKILKLLYYLKNYFNYKKQRIDVG